MSKTHKDNVVPGGYCPPMTLRAVAIFCYSLATFGGYRFGGSSYVVGLVAWHLLFVATVRFLRAYDSRALEAKVEGYPRWIYIISMVTGGCIVLALLASAVAAGAFESTPAAHAFMLDPIDRATWSAFFLVQANAALTAGLLKDFVVCDDGLEVAFTVHHAVSAAGMVLCLTYPRGMGLVAVNGGVAELGTQCWNYKVGRASWWETVGHIGSYVG